MKLGPHKGFDLHPVLGLTTILIDGLLWTFGIFMQGLEPAPNEMQLLGFQKSIRVNVDVHPYTFSDINYTLRIRLLSFEPCLEA